MKDELLWLMEYNGKGPFTCENNWRQIRQSILNLGPKADEYETNFLNIYDQNSTPAILNPVFKPYLKENAEDRDPDLLFGFRGKDALLQAFRFDYSDFGNKYLRQFWRLLDQDPKMTVVVYHTHPVNSKLR